LVLGFFPVEVPPSERLEALDFLVELEVVRVPGVEGVAVTLGLRELGGGAMSSNGVSEKKPLTFETGFSELSLEPRWLENPPERTTIGEKARNALLSTGNDYVGFGLSSVTNRSG
jgi:hypothetical protein